MFVDMGLTFIHAALTASLNRDFVFRPMQTGRIMGCHSGAFLTLSNLQMSNHNIELRIGQRIRLSSLGVERCRFECGTGVVVGRSNRFNAIRVLMDGRKQPQTLHRSYIEVD